MSSVVIAIDGPAASGKGTLARRIAEHFGYAHLDTGALYRAVGMTALRQGGDPADPVLSERIARSLNFVDLDDPDLRTREAGPAASKVAVHPGVRAALLTFQRNFAKHPPQGAPGAVLDGRDIGTVICPDADVKLFITANPEIRAHRRYLEATKRGETTPESDILADIASRDARDSGRAQAPLAKAHDALLLDTTDLDIEAAVALALGLVTNALRSKQI
jgi:cytidylate kinase